MRAGGERGLRPADRIIRRGGNGQVATGVGVETDGRPGEARWVESGCSPYFQNTSLYPIIAHLEQLLGFEPREDVSARRDKLEAALARSGTAQPGTLRLMASLLGLPFEGGEPGTITQEQRERIRETALTLVAHEAERQPLVLAIEDLHWADPTSVAWIGRSLDILLGLPCVVLLTWRPTFAAPWLPQRQTFSVELGPLNSAQTMKMVDEFAGASGLGEQERALIVRQTDGVPLYVEELTQTMVNSVAAAAAAGPEDRSRAALSAPPLPATLLDSLTAHIDRAGAAKETAQWAAALGRGFSHVLLSAVVPFDERRLRGDLDVLLDTGLIIPDEVAGLPGYAFKHALIQEAAYAMLLKRTAAGVSPADRGNDRGRLSADLAGAARSACAPLSGGGHAGRGGRSVDGSG